MTMKMQNSFKKIIKALEKNSLILIFPHINGDGDTIGSCKALKEALILSGKEAYIVMEDNLAQFIGFLKDNDFKSVEEVKEIIHTRKYTTIIVDCGSLDRFPNRNDIFYGSDLTICVDHHKTSQGICDINLIDEHASATGVLIFQIIDEMSRIYNFEINTEIADGIFVAITTDTGNFQYSNTNKKCHEIMSRLYDVKSDFSDISIILYQSQPTCKIKLHSSIVENSELFCDERLILGTATKDLLEKYMAKTEHIEGVIDVLRSIDSVVVAGVIKEQEDGKFKVSLRSKSLIDVSEISRNIGIVGGGHIRAAGFTYEGELKNLKEELVKSIEEAFKDTENE